MVWAWAGANFKDFIQFGMVRVNVEKAVSKLCFLSLPDNDDDNAQKGVLQVKPQPRQSVARSDLTRPDPIRLK